MREHELILQNINCQRYQDLLETQLVDECELSDAELAFLDTHEKSCPECGMFASMLDTLENMDGDTKTDDTILNVVETVFDKRDKRRRREWYVGIAAAAMMAAAFAYLFVFTDETPTGPTFDLKFGSIARNGELYAQGHQLRLNGTVASPNSEDALLEIPDAIYMAIEQNAQLRLINAKNGDLTIALDSGRMAVYLVPDGPLDLLVELPWGTVDVTGTVFVVDASENTGQVEVIRGSVSVQDKKLSHRQHLGAGWRLGMSLGEKVRRRVSATDPLLTLLGIHERVEQPVELAEQPVEEDVTEHEAKKAAKQLAPKPSLETLLHEARACRLEKDWACAVAKYRKAAALYPNRPAAATAMVSAGQILLENMHQPGEALSFFKRYQKRRPTGGLGREALFGECNSLKTLGRRPQERKCLERYLEKYPGTLYSKMAKSRLTRIVEK